MIKKIKKKDGAAILNALKGGVVPKIGIHHIAVGRGDEVKAVVESLNNVESGNSEVKFWIGDFGTGKSFILQLIESVALKQNFVCSTIDLTPETRLYANKDFRAVSTYTKILTNLTTQTDNDGDALPTILDQWIQQLMSEVAVEKGIPLTDFSSEENIVLVSNKMVETARNFPTVSGFEFGQAVAKYFEGFMANDHDLQRNALRWLKGEYRAKSDSLRDLGIREIVNDQNYYDVLKNLGLLFVALGYKGFVISLDEAINLFKITTKQTREKNYEKILEIYNDALQGNARNLFINIGGTREFLEDEYRGLYSYNALRTRLEDSRFDGTGLRDLSRPVVKLDVLDQEEIFTLLQKLKEVFDSHYDIESKITEKNTITFMEHYLNRVGAREFLKPREVIKDYISLLELNRQNGNTTFDELINIHDQSPLQAETEDVASIEVY